MKLFTPIQVGGLTLKNRIIFPPLTTAYEARDGSISQRSLNFYRRLAQGGVSYMVLGDVAPVPTLSPIPKLLSDDMIPSFKLLTDAVHEHGCYIGAQVFHPDYDSNAIMELFQTGKMNELRFKIHHDMEHFCNEASLDQLADIQDKMVACAIRAVKAGFDVIQIHGDRLVGMLSSPITNKRADAYGGSLENRARFGLELVRKIKVACPSIPIEYKLSMIRMEPRMGRGGPTVEEGCITAKWLQDSGVNFFHVAQANHTNVGETIPPMGVQPYGCFVDMARQIKEVVDVPVSTVGRIVYPQLAEGIVASGKADLVGIGRQMLADPDWVNKVIQGKSDEIRYCIMCNKGCTDKLTHRETVGCVLNAETGYVGERQIIPAADKKRVVVVGGGIAGLEAARVAALRGHDVILYEKEPQLGGQINIAAVPPRKDEMRRCLDYLAPAVYRAGVKVICGTNANAGMILKDTPDSVIVATGANNLRLNIPGADAPHVLDAWQVLAGKQNALPNTVIIGGGLVGAETAEYLAVSQRIQVSIVEMQDKIAAEESDSIRPTLLANFDAHGVALYTSHTLREIRSDSIVCADKDGTHVEILCDSVVMAIGARPAVFEVTALTERGIPVTAVGDCTRVGDIEQAIKSGYDAACII